MKYLPTKNKRKRFLVQTVLLLSGILSLNTGSIEAQTSLTNIENASGETVFTSFDDGALLGLGEFGTGVIPIEGAGTRMMWYPAKAAFRAGSITNTGWDDVNIGDYSVAMGYNTTASGAYSTAMGDRTNASGNYSTAMGGGTTASGLVSMAIGDNTTASGDASTAMGGETTAASSYSLSIGEYNNANRNADGTLFVAGNGSFSTPSDALVLYQDAGLVVNGEVNVGSIPVEGTGTRMMWYPAKAAFRAGSITNTGWDDVNIGDYSVAMGYNTTASGAYSTAMGDRTNASGNYSTAMGGGTTASGLVSMAIGDNTTASGDASTAMGGETTAASSYSLSIGEYNNANRNADGTLFVVGNGSFSTPSDALVLDNTGDMTIAGNLTESSDQRLKTNITALEDGTLGRLATITPTTFEFKNQQTHPSGSQIGLIAQEVQKQFPELVSEASNGYLSVSYSKFTAVLLKGMQEQQEKIENQQSTIDELKEKTRRIAALEKQVSEIKDGRQLAGLPLSTFGVLLLGMGIGGALWWRSRYDQD